MNLEFKEIQNRIDEYLGELMATAEPRSLYAPIHYTLSQGGKRLRPVLTVLASKTWNKDSVPNAIRAGAAIEVFHNFTLLHDDIMDDAILRRGKESVFKKYGVNAAILSGDAMMIKAMQELVVSTSGLNQNAILTDFLQVALEVCEGQQMDIDFEKRDCPSLEEYLTMIKKKTAILPAIALKIGALIGGASLEDAAQLYNYGEHLGLAFQIQDDLLDAFGDADLVGKTIGGDIEQNKKTILFILAVQNADEDLKDELINLYNSSDNQSGKVKRVMEIFDKTSARDAAVELKGQYHEKCLLSLDKIEFVNFDRGHFETMATTMLNRSF